jgi:D-arabinose 1-dehydrogenase-like Zn-dependent alcohol dehydrogenase
VIVAQPDGSSTMRAMVFDGVGRPLRAARLPIPHPGPGQLLLRVQACGICRTDLHLLDGEVEISHPPRILGHQIVGIVESGNAAGGARVGVPWLGWTCGACEYCRSGRENLCPNARFTGRDIDGGMAEYALADERQERSVRSIANLTRKDAEEMLELAPGVPVRTHVSTYPLEAAGTALEDLRAGRFTGAAVIAL